MVSLPVFIFLGVLLASPAAAPSPVASTGTRQAPPPDAGSAAAVLSDVSSAYAQMEKNLEEQYAKLKKQAKDDIDALEARIKEMERQIAALKDQANKIQQVAQKLEELLPKIMAALGADSGGMRRTPPAKSDQLAALLASERTKAGLPSTPGFPNLTPGDFSTASSLPGSNGAGFLSGRIARQASPKVVEIDAAIDAKKKQNVSLEAQVAEREKQIAKLEADRQTSLADLGKRKEKALAEAARAQDARLVRVPTPTPK